MTEPGLRPASAGLLVHPFCAARTRLVMNGRALTAGSTERQNHYANYRRLQIVRRAHLFLRTHHLRPCMSISPLMPGVVIVSHQDHQATFINATFVQMLEWAYSVQHFGRSLI